MGITTDGPSSYNMNLTIQLHVGQVLRLVYKDACIAIPSQSLVQNFNITLLQAMNILLSSYTRRSESIAHQEPSPNFWDLSAFYDDVTYFRE